MRFLDHVQIGKCVPVDNKVGTAPHARNTVNGKADPLIGPHPHVQQREGQNQRIYDWRGQETEDAPFAYTQGRSASNVDAHGELPCRTTHVRGAHDNATVAAARRLTCKVFLGLTNSLNDAFDVG